MARTTEVVRAGIGLGGFALASRALLPLLDVTEELPVLVEAVSLLRTVNNCLVRRHEDCGLDNRHADETRGRDRN